MKPCETGFTFHHVGVACADIAAEAAQFAALGYVAEGEAFEDPIQGVRGVFMTGQSPRVELLEPIGTASGGVLAPWLAKGIKLYHLAYFVPELEAAIH